MAQTLRFTNEQIVSAYKQTGSVWKAAKTLGACGQSVWERLKRLGFQMASEKWSADEIRELESLAPSCTIGEIARRLGRPYAGVACKLSELGIGVRGNKSRNKLKRGSGLTKITTAKYAKDLFAWTGSLRQFCVQRGFAVDVFVKALQVYEPGFWTEYARSHSTLPVKICPQCRAEFVPMNNRQRTCSRACQYRDRVDREYFGGKRSLAVGMEEGVCQLCEKEKGRLAAHHIYGKEHDQENDHMIALCPGCHALVGHLGVRSDVHKTEFWENLISLAVARKLGHRKPLGFQVCVEIEELTNEDFTEDESECA